MNSVNETIFFLHNPVAIQQTYPRELYIGGSTPETILLKLHRRISLKAPRVLKP